MLTQSIEPLFEADLVELVDAPHIVAPGVRLISTPGHTPGHVSVEIKSAGQRAIITGDCFHHPCQIARPQWSTRVDADRAQSSATRAELLEDISGSECLLIGSHFSRPFAGRVVWSDDAHRLVPLVANE